MSQNTRNLEWLRQGRELFGDLDHQFGFSTTVFLGLYQGSNYFPERLRELDNQTSQDFYLLIVDNYSSDFDVKQVVKLLETSKVSKGRYQIVRNPVNLGGLGSFQLNLDLVPSPWITYFHQDDQYLSNHLKIHLSTIKNSSSEVVSISTDLGSLDNKGRKVAVPPRANWFIQGTSQLDQFIAIVGEQVIPFPGLSIRTNQVEPDTVPWHTAAFSDTEQTLLSLMNGRHEFVKKETVLYRENPNSESHTQGEKIRIHSATIGLIRVFCSEKFKDFVLTIPKNSRSSFVTRLQTGIGKRLPNPDARDIVWSVCLEQLSQAWVYEDTLTTSQISQLFGELGQSYTPEILNGILRMSDNSGVKSLMDLDLQTNQLVKAKEDNTKAAELNIEKPKFRLMALLFQIVGRFPYFLRRRIFKLYHWFRQKVSRSNN